MYKLHQVQEKITRKVDKLANLLVIEFVMTNIMGYCKEPQTVQQYDSFWLANNLVYKLKIHT